MGVSLRILVVLFFVCSITDVFSQSVRQDYLEAKRLFATKDYKSSEAAFSSLELDPNFGPYARFYSGLSIYKSGNISGAITKWKQLIEYYPNWDMTPEVLFWLALSSFEEGQDRAGLEYVDSYVYKTTTSGISDKLIPKYLSEDSLSYLEALYADFRDNRALGTLIAGKIASKPTKDQNMVLLKNILTDHEIRVQEIRSSDLISEKRSSYRLAVTLPFMFDDLENIEGISRNALVMNFWQGMNLAAKDLAADSIFLELYPYDTKRSADTTELFIDQLANADVLVGPLFPLAVQKVSEFSSDRQINMVNPLSSNDDYLKDNPFAFLFRSGYQTMAKNLSKYILENDTSKTVAIYFSPNQRDSLFASTCQQILSDSGRTIVGFRSIDELGAKALLDTLTDQFELFYTKDEADSIMELNLEARFIKSRKLRPEELEYLEELEEKGQDDEEEEMEVIPWFYEEDEEGNILNEEDPTKMVYYEMKFNIPKDSVENIVIATRSNTIANNILGAIAAREDSTRIYGYGDWFDFKVVNYEMMEQLSLRLIVPDYLDKQSNRYKNLSSRISNEFNSPASKFHIHGYEFTYSLGNLLKRYGTYFQTAIYGASTSGFLSDGVEYLGYNDNQLTPVVYMRNFTVYPAPILSTDE